MKRGGIAILVLLYLVLPWVMPTFYVTLANYIGLASIIALGLVLLTGVGGQTSFGQNMPGAWEDASPNPIIAYSFVPSVPRRNPSTSRL